MSGKQATKTIRHFLFSPYHSLFQEKKKSPFDPEPSAIITTRTRWSLGALQRERKRSEKHSFKFSRSELSSEQIPVVVVVVACCWIRSAAAAVLSLHSRELYIWNIFLSCLFHMLKHGYIFRTTSPPPPPTPIPLCNFFLVLFANEGVWGGCGGVSCEFVMCYSLGK